MKNIKAFISSAERELESEREISKEVVNQLNIDPILFELTPALSNSPFNAYLEKVEECLSSIKIKEVKNIFERTNIPDLIKNRFYCEFNGYS